MRCRWLALLVALLASCASDAQEAPRVRSNVIWIIADGLRHDHAAQMESYRELAKQGTVHSAATAAASDCIASIGTMFTGLLPSEHGAHIVRVRRNDAWAYHQQALQASHRTLAELFSELGYDTALATANLQFADLDLGLAQGFDELLLSQGAAPLLNTRIEGWLSARTDKPFFLVVDYADTQLGYSAAPGEPEPETDSPEDTHRIVQEIEAGILGGTEYSETELELLKARYADGVASLDFGVMELLRGLRERKLFDPAVVVLSSDHGESLGEHNLLRHGRGAFEELLHVPLVIKQPGQKKTVSAPERTSLVHLPNMILTLALPDETDPGGGYFTQHADESTTSAEQWYSYPSDFGQPWSDRFDQVLRILYHRQWKYIASDEGHDQLYRLGQPNVLTASGATGKTRRELDNQVENHPGVAADMQMRIKQVYGNL